MIITTELNVDFDTMISKDGNKNNINAHSFKTVQDIHVHASGAIPLLIILIEFGAYPLNVLVFLKRNVSKILPHSFSCFFFICVFKTQWP